MPSTRSTATEAIDSLRGVTSRVRLRARSASAPTPAGRGPQEQDPPPDHDEAIDSEKRQDNQSCALIETQHGRPRVPQVDAREEIDEDGGRQSRTEDRGEVAHLRMW
ncbi:MAG: hypothetical protein HYZ58_05130 [Acidobacteria bacterium]|nr:hypothetical protein [Acidobacteriota bacterium]